MKMRIYKRKRENGPHTKFAGMPPCAESVFAWEQWKLAARIARPDPKIGFCEDCIPEYQSEMKLQNRCVNQGILFFREPKYYAAIRNGKEIVGTYLSGGGIKGAFKAGSYGCVKTGKRVFDTPIE